MREILTSKQLPAPRFRYSPCIKTGPHYFMAGMIALNPESKKLEPDGPQAETRRILANLKLAMQDYGLTLEHLVSARIYSTRFEEFDAINRAWEEMFDGSVAPPVRTSVGVNALPLGASVEMEFAFYKD